MATQTFEPSDFDKLFTAKAEANPQHAEVGENLSGQAQLLKSADNSLVQKNLQGNTIEENILIEKAQHQTIQTNQTDAYEPGVSTDLTEVAPSIHTQYTLTEGIVQTTTQKNLNVTTQDERETYHQANVERYHKTLQSNMPTELDQTIQQSGESIINTQQNDIPDQTINSATYTQKFGQFDHLGDVSVSSDTHLGTQSLIIGGGGDTSPIDFTLRKAIKEAIPKISTKIVGKTLILPPIITQGFMVTGTLEVSGNLIAKGQSPVSVTVDKEGLILDLQNKVNDYFAGLSFKSFSDFSDPMSNPPTIEVGNENGNMEFSNGGQLEVIGPYVKVVYHSAFTINDSNYEGWKLKSDSSATLTAYFTPHDFATAYRPAERFAKVKLSEFYQYIFKVVHELAEDISSNPSPALETAVAVGVIVLVSPVFVFIAG